MTDTQGQKLTREEEKELFKKRTISLLVNDYQIEKVGVVLILYKYRITRNGNKREYYKVLITKPDQRRTSERHDVADITDDIHDLTGIRLSADRKLIADSSDDLLERLATALSIKPYNLIMNSQRIK